MGQELDGKDEIHIFVYIQGVNFQQMYHLGTLGYVQVLNIAR